METGGWLLGGEFEDSVFEEGRERRSGPPASYRAKLCEPQCFYEETESSDDVEALTLKKFRGDLAYRRQDYQVEVTVHETALLAMGSCSVGHSVFQGRTAEKALQEYSSISEKLPPTNFAMKRDVQEGQARCLARLGRRAEALEIAADLETRATNTDHLTSALHLRLAVWSGGPASGDTVLCLQKLISLHPFNPWTWGRLAEAYLNLEPDLSAPFASCHTRNSCTSSGKTIDSSFPHTEKDCPLCCPETLPESSVFPMETSSRDEQKEENALAGVQDSAADEREAVLLETQMKACACLIRTRLLLQLSQPQQTSFALERNLRTQEEIEDKMKGFGFQEDTLLLIAEVMGKDIVPEKIKDEVHSEVKCVGSAALSALVVASSKEFEAKWFGKIKDHLCSSEGRFHAQIQISAS